MKTYELLFVHGFTAYAIKSREDEVVITIKTELKDGAILTYIQEVK